MLVGERMSHPVISVPPQMPISDALSLMKRKHIRRTPVIQDGRLVGIISDKDLLYASPATQTRMNVWEMNYLVSKTMVREVMTSPVITVEEDMPIERAALLMVENKIGGVPVLNGEHVTGIITETDLFKVFIELMGARQLGVRVTVRIKDERGQLARLTQAISGVGGNFIAFGMTYGQDAQHKQVTFKVSELTESQVRDLVQPLVEQIIDLRTCANPTTS